jgi:hypothetical protein
VSLLLSSTSIQHSECSPTPPFFLRAKLKIYLIDGDIQMNHNTRPQAIVRQDAETWHAMHNGAVQTSIYTNKNYLRQRRQTEDTALYFIE